MPAQLGPDVFEIQLSDSFSTLNPNDPIVGIDLTAVVPVTVNWNLARTDLISTPEQKEVTFGEIRWEGAGAGPHDIFEEKLGGQREKVGTVTWSITLEYYKIVQTNGGLHRWLVTPCPILYRTEVRSGQGTKKTEILKQPVPCPGAWVKTPKEVATAATRSIPTPKRAAALDQIHTRERVHRSSKNKG